jgi:PhnB protein
MTNANTSADNASMRSSIAPWLSVKNGHTAVEFYKTAFNAIETYRLDMPDGLVVRLSVNGAEFWVSSESGNEENSDTVMLGGNNVRMILTVPNPDELFAQAIEAGAEEIFPVGEDHGWRLGRLCDPFGLHWEIGYELTS